MSQPHEPTHDPADGTEPAGTAPEAGPSGGRTEPPVAGPQPSTESEPTPSAAFPAGDPADGPTAQMPSGAPLPPPAGHYVWVPTRTRGRFGPAFGRFVRNRATHLVAAVVVGAVVGGGTVAIVDNIADHNQVYQFPREGRSGGPFGGSGRQFPGYFVGPGGQGSGN